MTTGAGRSGSRLGRLTIGGGASTRTKAPTVVIGDGMRALRVVQSRDIQILSGATAPVVPAPDGALAMAVDAPLEVDPAVAWIQGHPVEVAACAGLRIAVHPTQGIVATGPSFEACFLAVRQLGMAAVDEAAIVFDVIAAG